MSRNQSTGEQGLTLLEVLVASVIMAIAVVGLLTNLSTSMRNAARLTNYDRASMLAQSKMNELLQQHRLPRNTVIEGPFDPAITGGVEAGWRALVRLFEAPPNPSPGVTALDRVELEIWWKNGEERRTFTLDAYKRIVLMPEDLPPGGARQ